MTGSALARIANFPGPLLVEILVHGKPNFFSKGLLYHFFPNISAPAPVMVEDRHSGPAEVLRRD
jgi:hypothetical protein